MKEPQTQSGDSRTMGAFFSVPSVPASCAFPLCQQRGDPLCGLANRAGCPALLPGLWAAAKARLAKGGSLAGPAGPHT